MRFTLSSFLVASLCALGCGDSDADVDEAQDEGPAGEPTGSQCPPNSMLTYANFGEDFFSSYCLRCHSVTVAEADRNRAPDDHNFDDVKSIRQMLPHIDGAAAGGPDAVNTTMPPSGDAPSDEERRQLGEWIACGAP